MPLQLDRRCICMFRSSLSRLLMPERASLGRFHLLQSSFQIFLGSPEIFSKLFSGCNLSQNRLNTLNFTRSI
ncbi:hypothetical protein TB9_08730 [Xanthomonas perforans]|uniref:Uncharacterized protein n=1 Tax=Xanthomonas perforans TaxID=442694 RepID=A0AAQ0YMM4_XANPE|nr:hypothetical protein BJD13_03840 [Xanthomonas perforans]AQS78519.1 hypothetical protein XPE_21700 [Xanthomonas perforans 91-118]KLC03937.1 hypothetical protein XP315_15380 [Xanthomonas perforans]KLC10117.1 hypothetical protein XP420_03300 [Xanthomonas perforans]KLC13250.1 hypothetical protein XP4B_04220 [Xanthomonas perforans]